jgi:hypothetical protein
VSFDKHPHLLAALSYKPFCFRLSQLSSTQTLNSHLHPLTPLSTRTLYHTFTHSHHLLTPSHTHTLYSYLHPLTPHPLTPSTHTFTHSHPLLTPSPTHTFHTQRSLYLILTLSNFTTSSSHPLTNHSSLTLLYPHIYSIPTSSHGLFSLFSTPLV